MNAGSVARRLIRSGFEKPAPEKKYDPRGKRGWGKEKGITDGEGGDNPLPPHKKRGPLLG